VTRLGSWLAVGVAAVAVIVIIAVSANNWQLIGDTGIDTSGWIALVLGALVTVAVGVGLMSLVFISNRRGYDDPTGGNNDEKR
jgi:hypothetical protein